MEIKNDKYTILERLIAEKINKISYCIDIISYLMSTVEDGERHQLRRSLPHRDWKIVYNFFKSALEYYAELMRLDVFSPYISGGFSYILSNNNTANFLSTAFKKLAGLYSYFIEFPDIVKNDTKSCEILLEFFDYLEVNRVFNGKSGNEPKIAIAIFSAYMFLYDKYPDKRRIYSKIISKFDTFVRREHIFLNANLDDDLQRDSDRFSEIFYWTVSNFGREDEVQQSGIFENYGVSDDIEANIGITGLMTKKIEEIKNCLLKAYKILNYHSLYDFEDAHNYIKYALECYEKLQKLDEKCVSLYHADSFIHDNTALLCKIFKDLLILKRDFDDTMRRNGKECVNIEFCKGILKIYKDLKGAVFSDRDPRNDLYVILLANNVFGALLSKTYDPEEEKQYYEEILEIFNISMKEGVFSKISGISQYENAVDFFEIVETTAYILKNKEVFDRVKHLGSELIKTKKVLDKIYGSGSGSQYVER